MADEYVCNQCSSENRFRVPADPVGVALMRAHLAEAHGLEDPR